MAAAVMLACLLVFQLEQTPRVGAESGAAVKIPPLRTWILRQNLNAPRVYYLAMKREFLGCGSQTNAASTFCMSLATAAVVAFTCLAGAPAAGAMDEKSIARFRDAMVKLAPGVNPAEAESVSLTSHQTARQLARDYRVVGPAVFQNFLIHIGARERGFCWHWARDIGTQLKELRLKTLYLHWGAADAGTHLEHNVIVVTAPNQSFREGYIIDAWRNAGRLCWWPVTKDSSYRWKEDLKETAWLHDYELVQQKPAAPPKPAPQQKTQKATASLEIRG
jgi:hypothetical protein